MHIQRQRQGHRLTRKTLAKGVPRLDMAVGGAFQWFTMTVPTGDPEGRTDVQVMLSGDELAALVDLIRSNAEHPQVAKYLDRLTMAPGQQSRIA